MSTSFIQLNEINFDIAKRYINKGYKLDSLQHIIDNSIDEYVMGYGKKIEVKIKNKCVTIRDFGRGIPLGKVLECVSQINTGGKYDSEAFKKSIGLNGVGTKAVNALSEAFKVFSIRDGQKKEVDFSKD